MPVRKHVYKYPVQFVPRSYGDLLKDDPAESKNVIVPLEPETWKHGIYFNDGYDYEQHLVTLDEFRDESKELPKINYDKHVNIHPSFPTKVATIVNEFEINDGYDVTEEIITNIDKITAIDKVHDDMALEKLRQLAKSSGLDEDVLFALNNAKCEDEQSELDDIFDDNFIELANGVPNSNKNQFMIDRFFGNDRDSNENDNFEKQPQPDSKDNFDFCGELMDSIDDISVMKHDCGSVKKLKLSDNSTSYSTMSLSFINRFERYNEIEAARKEFIKPLNENDKKYIMCYEESEYNEAEVNKAVDKWAERDEKPVKNAMNFIGKICTNMPKEMVIERKRKSPKKQVEKMDTESVDSDSASTITPTDISSCHVARPRGETAEEKRLRKRTIKMAKRERQVQKKEIRNAFSALSK